MNRVRRHRLNMSLASSPMLCSLEDDPLNQFNLNECLEVIDSHTTNESRLILDPLDEYPNRSMKCRGNTSVHEPEKQDVQNPSPSVANVPKRSLLSDSSANLSHKMIQTALGLCALRLLGKLRNLLKI